ncbi:MAG: DJ-1 family protein [Nitrospiraceae bacterium]|nr:DJ-1 family protein [Nitrospiraceae bacterium]
MSQKRVLVLLAPGFEELEAVAVIDILRRAGLEVVTAGQILGPIASARNIRISPDTTLDKVSMEAFDLIVLPGGVDGTENLAKDPRVIDILRRQIDSGRLLGAICGAPTVLDRHGLIKGKNITCHPTCRETIDGARLSGDRVVQDGRLVTSQGPGTAIEFAYKLVELLIGRNKVSEINKGVLALID